jgi:putative oxidoreductase
MEDDATPSAKLLVPGLGRFYRRFSRYSYAFMRFSAGAVLVPHGVQKVLYVPVAQLADSIAARGFAASLPLAYLAFFSELVAAACLALGLFTRIAALIIWIEMAVIIISFNGRFGYFWTNRGFEFALLWLLLCTAIFFRGGGRYSLDRLIGREF